MRVVVKKSLIQLSTSSGIGISMTWRTVSNALEKFKVKTRTYALVDNIDSTVFCRAISAAAVKSVGLN